MCASFVLSCINSICLLVATGFVIMIMPGMISVKFSMLYLGRSLFV